MTTWQLELPSMVYNPEALTQQMIKADIPGFTGVSTRNGKIFACFLEEVSKDTPELREKVFSECYNHDCQRLSANQQRVIKKEKAKAFIQNVKINNPDDPLIQAIHTLLDLDSDE